LMIINIHYGYLYTFKKNMNLTNVSEFAIEVHGPLIHGPLIIINYSLSLSFMDVEPLTTLSKTKVKMF
jgi:hypothetical protein